MKRRFQDVDLRASWEDIPMMRRHLYFYLLLILVTVVASSFRHHEPITITAADETAPPLTATEVYETPGGR